MQKNSVRSAVASIQFGNGLSHSFPRFEGIFAWSYTHTIVQTYVCIHVHGVKQTRVCVCIKKFGTVQVWERRPRETAA